MSPEERDCIGAGTYYQLQRPPLRDTDGQSTKIDDAPSLPMEQYNSEVRFHPDTGEPYYLSAIVSDLRNPDWYVRIRAAWALGSTRDIEGLVPLIEALNDEHNEVRDRANDALKLASAVDGPLDVRVMLCETVDDATRTDILIAVTRYHLTRGLSSGQLSAKGYCETWLETDASGMSEDEKVVLASLKRAAAAVLAELSNRSDSNLLLRASDSNSDLRQSEQLLRSSEPGHRPGEVENLLLPSSAGTEGT